MTPRRSHRSILPTSKPSPAFPTKPNLRSINIRARIFSVRRVFVSVILLVALYSVYVFTPRSTAGSKHTSLISDCVRDVEEPPLGRLYHIPPLKGAATADNFSSSYVPFKRSDPSTLLPAQHVSTRVNTSVLPSMLCLDDLLTHGVYNQCLNTDPDNGISNLDVVWTWANGSDSRYRQTHDTFFRSKITPLHKTGLFREFDELRYSLRSVLQNLRYPSSSSSRFHVITSDFEFPWCSDNLQSKNKHWRLGQVPQWLSAPSTTASEPITPIWKDGTTDLSFIHHSNLFGATYRGLTYNSLAIESRLGYLEGVSENFLYMNDDIFLADQVTATDFYSPVFGPVFRMQSDLLTDPNRPRVGEWIHLQHSNDLLNKRFGNRNRPYIAHTVKTLSLPILRELNLIWPEAFNETANHELRGDVQSPDVSTTFLAIHYQVERWREALLWSWVIGRLGQSDDKWTTAQADQAWKELGGHPDEERIIVNRAARQTLDKGRIRAMHGTNPEPTHTVYSFTSLDGYPYAGMGRSGFKSFPSLNRPEKLKHHIASRCQIDRKQCFSPIQIAPGGVLKSSDIFKHVTYRAVHCGDCIIAALIKESGPLGLSAFLPARTKAQNREYLSRSLPLSNDWTNTNFTLQNVMKDIGLSSIRDQILQMLARYRFVIGNTPTSFARLETPNQARSVLRRLDSRDGFDDPVLLCVNDDVRMNTTIVGDMFKRWMASRWPIPAAWEGT